MAHNPLTITDTHGRHIFRDFRMPMPRLLIYGFLGLFWGGCALFFAGALLLADVHTPLSNWGTVLVFNALFTLPIGFLGLLLVSRYIKLCGLRVALDNTGLILWTCRGHTAVTWDDITALYVGAYPRPHVVVRGVLLVVCTIPYLLSRAERRRHYTVCLRDGRRLYIPSAFPGKDALAGIIGSAIAQDRLPAMLGRYREGEGCDFGAVRVAYDGLHIGKKMLPWEEIDRIAWNRARLRVFRKGKHGPWSIVPLTSLPNPWLFLALVRPIYAERRRP